MSGGLEPADLGLAKTFAEGNTEVPPSLVPLFPLPSSLFRTAASPYLSSLHSGAECASRIEKGIETRVKPCDLESSV